MKIAQPKNNAVPKSEGLHLGVLCGVAVIARPATKRKM